jgi:CheY-like chemotaxis protein/HPt (histidine-containing phosphotransfer) domain-containing protein
MLRQVENDELDGYLIKPVTRSQLFDAIMRVLGQKRSIWSAPGKKVTAATAMLEGLRGGHILLVEDNEINQMVAVEILQSMGLKVSLAKNGNEAVQMVANERFDVVLMDIQMPGMDGYQATAKIRNELQFGPEKLPIIAMTAHALSGDREKVLEAGLNDYVSKPVNVLQLANVLMRWLVPQVAGLQEGGLEAIFKVESARLPALSFAGLETEKALKRLGGNQVLYRRLLALFRQDRANGVQELRSALDGQDFELAHRLAHTLKGVAGTIGADELSEAARQMEEAIKNEQPALFENQLERLEYWMAVTLRAISKLEELSESDPLRQVKVETTNKLLSVPQLMQLSRLLRENTAEAVNLIGTLLSQIDKANMPGELKDLEKLIRRYDYENALKSLQALATTWKISLADE